MIKIDGSYGEGGGQILRYAAALAAATGKKIEVINIRIKRPNPGLRPQHLTSLKILKILFGGTIEGLHIGSKRVIISLGGPKSGSLSYDIGTAGSIPLVIQSIVPALILADSSSTILLIGGTDVKWSPTIDYMKYVYTNMVSLFNAEIRISILRRGYYPKGGGKVKLEVSPSSSLSAVSLGLRNNINNISLYSVVSLLPEHILNRQVSSALEALKKSIDLNGYKVNVYKYLLDYNEAGGPGTSLLVVANHNDKLFSGGDSIGEKGKPAEVVGKEAVIKFMKWFSSEAALDVNAGDMIIPFVALSKLKSYFTVPEITNHIKSALYVVEKILGIKHKVTQVKGKNCFKIEVS